MLYQLLRARYCSYSYSIDQDKERAIRTVDFPTVDERVILCNSVLRVLKALRLLCHYCIGETLQPNNPKVVLRVEALRCSLEIHYSAYCTL